MTRRSDGATESPNRTPPDLQLNSPHPAPCAQPQEDPRRAGLWGAVEEKDTFPAAPLPVTGLQPGPRPPSPSQAARRDPLLLPRDTPCLASGASPLGPPLCSPELLSHLAPSLGRPLPREKFKEAGGGRERPGPRLGVQGTPLWGEERLLEGPLYLPRPSWSPSSPSVLSGGTTKSVPSPERGLEPERQPQMQAWGPWTEGAGNGVPESPHRPHCPSQPVGCPFCSGPEQRKT